MLVLSRKVGEQIVIPDLDVVLTVVRVKGNRVRIGVEAPENVKIHRREVWERPLVVNEMNSLVPSAMDAALSD